MSKKLLSTLIASLFAAAPVLAQSVDDPIRVEGGATAGGIYNRQNGDDKAKLQEYQDLGNGALTNVWARGRNSTNWFEGYGENFGRNDQYMFLRGGIYDVFKAGAYFNEMPHDFSTNAITPYAGVGSGLLQSTFPQLNPANWNSFNLGYERKDAGGYFEWQKNSPWYFRVDGNQVKFDGTKVGSAALGTSPGNGYIALPIPVQTSTANVGVEGGWQTQQGDVLAALGLQQVRQRDRLAQLDEPVQLGLGVDRVEQPARQDVPAAGQHLQQDHGDRQLPRPAVGLGDIGALHVVEDDEQRRPPRDRAQQRDGAGEQPDVPGSEFVPRREPQPVVRAGMDGAPGHQRRVARLLLLDEAAEQVGRKSLSVTTRYRH